MKVLYAAAAVVLIVCGLVFLFGKGSEYREKERFEYLEYGVWKDKTVRTPSQWEALDRERQELRRKHPEWKANPEARSAPLTPPPEFPPGQVK